MYFSSLCRRGVRSSLTKTCCLPLIFLRSLLLVRNTFRFLYDTNLAIDWAWILIVSSFLADPMHSLYIIILEIDFELICYFKQDLFPIIVVFFIFFYSINKNIFSSYVLFLSVKLKKNQNGILNRLIA